VDASSQRIARKIRGVGLGKISENILAIPYHVGDDILFRVVLLDRGHDGLEMRFVHFADWFVAEGRLDASAQLIQRIRDLSEVFLFQTLLQILCTSLQVAESRDDAKATLDEMSIVREETDGESSEQQLPLCHLNWLCVEFPYEGLAQGHAEVCTCIEVVSTQVVVIGQGHFAEDVVSIIDKFTHKWEIKAFGL